tara:strand:- start:848 stop:1129 length:282 start_codon:yes stop_codon:yes gene_type:complete
MSKEEEEEEDNIFKNKAVCNCAVRNDVKLPVFSVFEKEIHADNEDQWRRIEHEQGKSVFIDCESLDVLRKDTTEPKLKIVYSSEYVVDHIQII